MGHYLQLALLACVLIAEVNVSFSFYLPGLAPVNYCENKTAKDNDRCKVNLPALSNLTQHYPDLPPQRAVQLRNTVRL